MRLLKGRPTILFCSLALLVFLLGIGLTQQAFNNGPGPDLLPLHFSTTSVIR